MSERTMGPEAMAYALEQLAGALCDIHDEAGDRVSPRRVCELFDVSEDDLLAALKSGELVALGIPSALYPMGFKAVGIPALSVMRWAHQAGHRISSAWVIEQFPRHH